MKKTVFILTFLVALGIPAFSDALIFKDYSLYPINGTSIYGTYNVRDWSYGYGLAGISGNTGSAVLFSLPSPEHMAFYLGSGTSLNDMYGLPGISLSVNSALAFTFHEESWPQLEFFLYTRAGCGIIFIKGIDFYMFVNATPYVMLMPPKGRHGFFFGAGPQFEYLQGVNWELYNRISAGLSLAGGFRFRRKK